MQISSEITQNIHRPRQWLVRSVYLLLILHGLLLLYSSMVHSPTVDEPAHLAAGLSHIEFCHHHLYRVNPPLIRTIAALPVYAIGYEADWLRLDPTSESRQEFLIGLDLVKANKERVFLLMTIARWACIPFSLIGAWICFAWARDLYGDLSGLVACALWCFSPSVLGHGALITADIHASALGVAAAYSFWRWLINPTWKSTIISGVILGVAELSKTTLIIFLPLWPLLWLAYRWKAKVSANKLLEEAGMLLIRTVIALTILNIGYGFSGSFQKLEVYEFKSAVLGGQQEAASGNRFESSLLGHLPVPFPADYVLGIDLQQVDFESGKKLSYFGGVISTTGWWWWYLLALEVKLPLGTILLLCGLGTGLLKTKGTDRGDSFVLLSIPIFVLLVVSCKSSYTNHLRYAFPALPFLFIYLGQVGSVFNLENDWKNKASVGFLIGWILLSSLSVYPHSLSYFNELAGGPSGGSRYLVDSNIDWGQDLIFLKSWLHENQKDRPLYLAYYGNIRPRYVDFEETHRWPNEFYENQVDGKDALYAISTTLLQGMPHLARNGGHGSGYINSEMLDFFRKKLPVGRAGYSILIYEGPNIEL